MALLKGILNTSAAFSSLHINYDKHSGAYPIHMDESTTKHKCTNHGLQKTRVFSAVSGITAISAQAASISLHPEDRQIAHGRAVLVNSVLDSKLVYFMSSIQLPPWVIHQMDRRRRAFLWPEDINRKASSRGHRSAGRKTSVGWESKIWALKTAAYC